MPDYQEKYLILMRATEKAIRALIEAQQQCEELYLSAEEPPLQPLSKPDNSEEKDAVFTASPHLISCSNP